MCGTGRMRELKRARRQEKGTVEMLECQMFSSAKAVYRSDETEMTK